MCGLFGWCLTPEVTDAQRHALAVVLALENEKRGKDSWGYCNLLDRKIEKGLGKVGSFIHTFWDVQNVLAHARFATMGAVTVENSHPFSYKHIIGAHNGIVESHFRLNTEFKRDFNVDSQHLFAHLAEGISKENLNSYGAMTYVDTRQPPGNMYFSRFNGGTLTVGAITIPGKKAKDEVRIGVIWSSTEEAVQLAMRVAGVDGFLWKIEPELLYELRTEDFNVYRTGKKFKPAELNSSRSSGGRTWHSRGHWDFKTQKWVDDDVKKEEAVVVVKPGVDEEKDESYWGTCSQCKRSLFVTNYAGVEVCAICEETYLENLAGEERAKAVIDEKAKVEENEVNKADEIECDWCGLFPAVLWVKEFEGNLCVECIKDAEVNTPGGALTCDTLKPPKAIANA